MKLTYTPMDNQASERRNLAESQTMSDILKSIRPYLKEGLVSAEKFAVIEEMARFFPALLTRSYLLECRLNSNEQTDWCFCLEKDSRGAAALAGYDPQRIMSGYFFENKVWQRIRKFFLKWCNLEPARVFQQAWEELNSRQQFSTAAVSSLYRNILNVWLEFDMVNLTAEVPVPSFFFQLLNITGVSGDLTFLETALSILNGDSFNQGVYNRFTGCLRQAPAGIAIKHVGTMLGRDDDALRFYLYDVPHDDTVIGYLADIGWPGSLQDFRSFFTDLLNRVDRKDKINLEVVVGRDIPASMALEYRLHSYEQPSEDWGCLLNNLVRLGLCTPVKRDGLLQWQGEASHQLAADPHPLRIRRFINHLKLTLNQDASIKAKAYLRIMHD